MRRFEIRQGDSLRRLRETPDGSANCCVTSPPYWGLRDYGVKGQLGLERTPDEYVSKLVEIFREVKRVLTDDATLWLNLGDSYAGSWGAQSRPNGNDIKSTLQGGSMLSARQIEAHTRGTHTGSLKNTPGLKPKDLVGIPWMTAFALRADGWYLRSDIIWSKPNPMPESVTDRPSKAHEYIFLLSKSEQYYFDNEAVKEPLTASTVARYAQSTPMTIAGQFQGHPTEKRYQTEGKKIKGGELPTSRNVRSVWTVTTQGFSEAHFATFPPELIKPCILAGCPEGGTVLDPFSGAGTTGLVALRHNRHYIGIELNPAYVEMSRRRILHDSPLFNEEVA